MSGVGKRTLDTAKAARQDEFYTQLPDITNELKHYKDQLRGKVVLCNCDDPYESNFFQYFALNFGELGLKKLLCTSYAGSPIVGELFPPEEMAGMKPDKKEPYLVEINEVGDLTKDGAIGMADIDHLLRHDANTTRPLKGNDIYGGGDFRSPECVEVLKQADVVVTNPPFSLFREYLAQLVEFEKQFVIIGNTNAITYREIFPLIKTGKMRTGNTKFNVGMFFVVPDDWEKFHHIDEKSGRKIARVSTSCWYTSLDVAKHREFIPLHKKYTSAEYPKYDNFDAINVNQVADIPADYEGAMGVPITFLDKHNPDQFEIIGLGISNSGIEIGVRPYEPKHKKYRKEVQRRGAVDGDLYMIVNGIVEVPYARVLIKRKASK